MPLKNTHLFVRNIIDWGKFAQGTNNQYMVINTRKYIDKKGLLEDGITVVLQVIVDNIDYGFTKQGDKRDNNLYETFSVTILDSSLNLSKGDIIELIGFIPEKSFAIGFDLLLRFKSAKVLKPANIKGAKPNA